MSWVSPTNEHPNSASPFEHSAESYCRMYSLMALRGKPWHGIWFSQQEVSSCNRRSVLLTFACTLYQMVLWTKHIMFLR